MVECRGRGSPESGLDDLFKARAESRGKCGHLYRGRDVHAIIQARYSRPWEVEPTFPGARFDLYNFDTKSIIEIKPNNAAGIKSGRKQLDRYAGLIGGDVNTILLLYDVVE